MRVIAPDLLGYGRSEHPQGVDLSELAQATYARELIKHLGIDELAVIGHDIGGAVAQLLALDPEGLAVRAMVLVDSVGFDTWPIEGVRRLSDYIRAHLQLNHDDLSRPRSLPPLADRLSGRDRPLAKRSLATGAAPLPRPGGHA